MNEKYEAFGEHQEFLSKENAQLRTERDTLKVENERLRDRQNDAAALLDSANGTINRLEEQLEQARRQIQADQNLDLKLVAAEAARQDTQEKYADLMLTLTLQESRLTKAEAALKMARELWETGIIDSDQELACLDFGTARKMDATLAALQPEGEPK